MPVAALRLLGKVHVRMEGSQQSGRPRRCNRSPFVCSLLECLIEQCLRTGRCRGTATDLAAGAPTFTLRVCRLLGTALASSVCTQLPEE